jgi:hypothetical protein
MAISVNPALMRRFAVAVCLLLAVPATAALAAVPAGTAGRSVPSPGQDSILWNVWCTRASSDCWAVGDAQNAIGAELNEALHWTGGRWSVVRTPDPSGTTAAGDFNALFGVACTSVSNCWAVGLDYKAGHPGKNQVLHWNGKSWTVVPVPELGGTANGAFNSLLAVRCPSVANCWAVGSANKSLGSAGLNQALHWDGRKWSLVPTPDPGGTSSGALSELNGVGCGSAHDCWAVGDYAAGTSASAPTLSQALHWNGRIWSRVRTPNPGGSQAGDTSELFGAFCVSPRDCWAAGWSGNTSTNVNLVLHWDGRAWSQVAAPDPDGTGAGAQNMLIDVTCTSPAGCWAVGQFGSIRAGGGGVILNEILRWNGHAWSLIPSPDPGGTANRDANVLERVRCASQANCWAVGSTQPAGGAGRNEALHWNGHRWLPG